MYHTLSLQVRGGGHVDCFTPIYRSESVGQVYLFVITWLYLLYDIIPADMRGKIWLCYDAMCKLTKTRAMKEPLPLPEPYSHMFLRLNKAVDELHIRNHTEEYCLQNLKPSRITDMHPDLTSRNTMSAEQTFVWLARYKRITSSMPRNHHLFFIHRMVTLRNRNTAACYKAGKKPLLPTERNYKFQRNTPEHFWHV